MYSKSPTYFPLPLKKNPSNVFLSVLYCSKQGAIPLCNEGHDVRSYYKPLVSCISGTTNKRWTPIRNRSSSPHQLNSAELEIHGKYYSIICFFFWVLSLLGRVWLVPTSECIKIFMVVSLPRSFSSTLHFMVLCQHIDTLLSLQESSLTISLKTYRFGDQL